VVGFRVGQVGDEGSSGNCSCIGRTSQGQQWLGGGVLMGGRALRGGRNRVTLPFDCGCREGLSAHLST